MSATETRKATAGTSQTINEFFHQALRISVHGALEALELPPREVVSVGLDSRPELNCDLPAVEGSNNYTALWKALEPA